MSTESSSRVQNAETTGLHSGEPEESEGLEGSEGPEEDASPRELESALLTLAMFGGLIVFVVGCTMLGWN